MSKRVIAPAALVALKQALTDVYWYKADLRSFLTATLSKPEILARVDWEGYKRNIVSSVVDLLARNQDAFQADLLRLMSEVARVDDFSHLVRLEDGKKKAKQAERSVVALRKLVGKPPKVAISWRRFTSPTRDHPSPGSVRVIGCPMAVALAAMIVLGASIIGFVKGIPSAFGVAGFGEDLWVVYVVWAVIVVALYPVSKWFGELKARRREWWLSYL